MNESVGAARTAAPGLLRVYLDPSEIGLDGYPYVWHQRAKDLIREQAGHRCERCSHPFVVRSGQGRWSPCDERCTHGGPIRVRDVVSDSQEWTFHPTTHGHPAGDGIVDFGPENHPVVRYDVEAEWRILTVHHLNGIKHDLRWWNLAALCQRCHLTIQAKVYLDRPYDRPHTEWFRPHAAGYYAASNSDDDGEPSREWVLANIDEILDKHAVQGTLL